jgi:hypothetical protein
MTEAEWVRADDRAINEAVFRLDLRRQRLLAAAACRALGKWIDFPDAHAALATIEAFADTGKTKVALRRARQAIARLRDDLYFRPARGVQKVDGGVVVALFTIQVAASENAVSGTVGQAVEALVYAEGIPKAVARRHLHGSYRDVIGNPFRPVSFDPAWRTSTAVALATQMYDSRDFSIMPILGDALQDAGCENADVLAHCRDPKGTHVRGCWVVDLILGKS